MTASRLVAPATTSCGAVREAYQWAANWYADDVRRISEVVMVRSWQEHLQRHRRLDTSALETIRRAETFGRREARQTARLLSFDVDDPSRRPDWAALLADHQEMHRPGSKTAGPDA